MNEKSLRILEYNKIIDLLINFAGSTMGKDLCKKLKPSNDIAEITAMQAETRDALTRIYQHGSLSFIGLKNIFPSLKRLEIGGSLNASELLDIARILTITLNAKQYSDSSSDLENTDTLDNLFEELIPLTTLSLEIKRCIISDDEISDDATSNLKNIRRNIKLTNDKIHNQLSSIISSASSRSMLQDSIITMRNGRYCIPVKQEYRSQFQGMIHDQSSSGSTLFIEPMSVVNLNNELKELAIKEQAEIDKILADLSEQVSYELDTIINNLQILQKLDFIFARASFAKSYNGSEPIFNENGIIDIKYGRHPLLDSKKVVPINIKLGTDFSMLLITGPNTGGKTVSLKTVGLFTLMGQAGLHIPAFEGSKLAVFDDVFADIGDEQSIEQNLSTFSSHMTSIVSILNNVTSNSLVLFDEIGGGTDPIEGAGLAISILSELHKSNIRTIATTHYSELKLFALSTDGVENACCEFDVTTLQPTYRLLIGVPGKSNAFAISKKLGLPDYIIENAKANIDENAQDFETLISNLEDSKITIEKEREEILKYKNEITELKKTLEEKNEDINQRKNEILRKAREEARDILADAKTTADNAIKKYNQLGKKAGNNRAMEQERTKLRKKLSNVESKLTYKSSRGKKKFYTIDDFKIGDTVYVRSFALKGTIDSAPNPKGEFYIQMGILRSLINVKDLELINEEKQKVVPMPNTNIKSNINKTATINSSINVIGKTVDEALSIIEKYLDDACMSHLNQITIIHGKGTGALRNAIQSYLKKQSFIKSFRNGAYGEGEAGVTVVEFK